ncbi:MAG: ABC transporter ATP-binding protein [Halobacteriales archaeon]|nr:ABC transporter ATP-binding protein [Halobacteriales archaeon]
MDVGVDESVAIIGRNGVGKTTVMRTALQLTPPREGEVRFKGVNVTGMDTSDVASMGMGWVPEDRRPFTQLTVEENLRISVKEDDVDDKVEEAFDIFPLLTDSRSDKANQLSGGEQQMLAMARALIGSNDLILVDEPSEGLSPIVVEEITGALEKAAEDTALLIIEQSLPLALELADRYYLLDNGRVVAQGETEGLDEDSEELTQHLRV